MTLMALGVPILYLIGMAFDQGYQSVFRVPEVARTGGFHETLTLGFFAIHYAIRFLNDWMHTNWYVMAIYGVGVGLAPRSLCGATQHGSGSRSDELEVGCIRIRPPPRGWQH